MAVGPCEDFQLLQKVLISFFHIFSSTAKGRKKKKGDEHALSFSILQKWGVGRNQQFTAEHGNMRAAAAVYDSTLAISEVDISQGEEKETKSTRLFLLLCCERAESYSASAFLTVIG